MIDANRSNAAEMPSAGRKSGRAQPHALVPAAGSLLRAANRPMIAVQGPMGNPG
jgi:hypothetical protein